MRKVILSMMVSADGYTARADGTLDWFLSDAQFEQEMLALLRNVDGMFFGRVAYQLLSQYWSAARASGGTGREGEFAHLMNAIPKTVWSRTMQHAHWGPVTIEREVDAERIVQRKREPGKDLVLFAGGQLASVFADLDLFDEYRLMVHPIILGTGIALFRNLTAERALTLRRSRIFPSGMVLLHYERDRH